MEASFYKNNRKKLAKYLVDGSIVFSFSGFAPRKEPTRTTRFSPTAILSI